jgi:hypothetical protein
MLCFVLGRVEDVHESTDYELLFKGRGSIEYRSIIKSVGANLKKNHNFIF